MQLDHFADAFQNDHASVDQFFNASNSLTEQYNPGYNPNVGYGFAQNTAGYEWGDDQQQQQQQYSHDQPHEFRGNGGYHTNIPQQPHYQPHQQAQCGADPNALARANLEWEARMTHNNGMGSGQHIAQETHNEPDFVYSGPDDLDFDDEEIAPKKGMEYWKKRTPTLLISGGTILAWIWMWSKLGFSSILTGVGGTMLYWGFITLMMIGVFQSDHRAALYTEEREILDHTESNLRTVVKLVGVVATLLLTFKVLKSKGKAQQQIVYTALGISFFVSLLSLVSVSIKKRGESVRRYRKVKAAALNLAIGLIAVAALISFEIGTTPLRGGGGSSVKQGGGLKHTVKAELPGEQFVIELAQTPPSVQVIEAPMPELAELAPGQQGGGGDVTAPTVSNYAPAPTQYVTAPTVLMN